MSFFLERDERVVEDSFWDYFGDSFRTFERIHRQLCNLKLAIWEIDTTAFCSAVVTLHQARARTHSALVAPSLLMHARPGRILYSPILTGNRSS